MNENKANYCQNCFREKGGFEVCPHCGWSEETDRREAYHLPAMSVINERYIIGRVLGFGGFGVTYKAWDTSLSIAVAIKEYYPAGLVNRIPNEKEVIAFSGDKRDVFETGLTRFLDEARNMAKFSDHPYIVNVYDFFEENNTAYIIMEFLDGETLKKYVEQCGGKISYEDALNVIEPIMRALEELHKANIIHRDVSPDNIYITYDNKIKLIDFGAARFSSGDKESTQSAIIKLGYAPPEQYRVKSRQGAWTDVYALGATIYRIVTGILPEESIDRAINDDLQRPSALGIEMPQNAEKAIMKAMALKEGLRFQKVSDMRLAFSDKKAIDYPEVEYKRRKRKRLFATIAVASFMLIALLSGGLFVSLLSVDAERIPKEKITVWVPTPGSDDYSTYLDDSVMSFLSFEETSKFEIELIGVAESDYEKKLKAAYGSEDMPDVFRTDYLSEESRQQMCADVSLYYLYFPAKDYFLFDKDKSELIEKKIIPTNFVIPVAYVNNSLLAKSGNETPVGFSSPAEMEYDISRLTAKYDTQFCTLYNERVIDNLTASLGEEGSKIKNDPAVSAAAETPMQIFSGLNALIYVGFSDEIVDIQNSEALKGIYATVPIQSETITGEYSETYGISESSSLNQKRLSMLFLSYLASTSNEGGLPLNRQGLDEYIENNAQFFGFMNEYADETEEIRYVDRVVSDLTSSEVENGR